MTGFLKRLFSRAQPALQAHDQAHLREPVAVPDPWARLDLQHIFGHQAATSASQAALRDLGKALRERLRHEADQALTLPRQPAVLPELIRWLNDDTVSHRQLADTIGRDPALSATLLKLANSVWFRTSPDPVETVPRAIAVVGLDGLRRLVAAALTMPVIRGNQSDPLREQLWQWALDAGELSRQVARQYHADEASLYLGTLVIALGYLTLYLNGLELAGPRHLRAEDVRSLMPQLTMAYRFHVARRIADHWQLTPGLRNAMRDLQQDAPRVPGSLPHGLALTLQMAHLGHLWRHQRLTTDELERFVSAQPDSQWYHDVICTHTDTRNP